MRSDRGFLMVALLIGMGVAAIMLTMALPKWGTQVQRTREDNLIFIGEQYARAIAYYALRNRCAYPMDLDVLVSGKFLRKKWKDPITGKDFQLVGIGVVQPGVMNTFGPNSTPAAGTGRMGGASQIATTGNPGISGVRSFSNATSIKVYQQQQQYSLWAFDAVTFAQQKLAINLQQACQGQGQGRQGGAGGARGGGDGRGGPGVGPGGRGGDGRAGGAPPGRGGGPPVPPPPGGRGGRGGGGGN
jgi:type II secretory pathway pseudopilin PulG